MPSRERHYFENHRSQENMLSPELQPHGFSHVVVGENSRTLPQLLTEGLKRVPPCALPGPRVPASSSKFPHARCSILSSSLPIVTTDPLGAELRCATFMKIETVGILNSRSKGQVSILLARLVVRGLARPKGDSFLLLHRCRDCGREQAKLLPRVLCLEKDQAPPPVSCSEDEP